MVIFGSCLGALSRERFELYRPVPVMVLDRVLPHGYHAQTSEVRVCIVRYLQKLRQNSCPVQEEFSDDSSVNSYMDNPALNFSAPAVGRDGFFKPIYSQHFLPMSPVSLVALNRGINSESHETRYSNLPEQL